MSFFASMYILQSSPFMALNIPPWMLLDSISTVVYSLESRIFFDVYWCRSAVFRLKRLTSGRNVVIHYARNVLCAGDGMACVSSCTVAHLGMWGPVERHFLTKVLPLAHPLSYYYCCCRRRRRRCCCCCCCCCCEKENPEGSFEVHVERREIRTEFW